MEKEELPGDASTLTYLAKADAFRDAARCLEAILVAPAVWREAVEDAERLGYPDPAHIRQAAEDGFVRCVELNGEEQALAGWIATEHRLGVGESEALALGRGAGRALLDDGRATRVAATLGVEPVSTLFLPALGCVHGSLDRSAAVAFLRRLAIVTGARAEAIYEIEAFIHEVPNED